MSGWERKAMQLEAQAYRLDLKAKNAKTEALRVHFQRLALEARTKANDLRVKGQQWHP